jgi:hypothetical protein
MYNISPEIKRYYDNTIKGKPLSDIIDIVNPLRNIEIDLRNSESEYLKIIKRHYLTGYVHDSLNKIKCSPEFVESISKIRKEKQLKMMKISSETIEISRLCDENQIKYAVIKGPAFSMLCFKDPGKKLSLDLDILIKKDDVKNFENILFSLGYKRISPKYELSPKQYSYNLKIMHHMGYFNPEKKVLVEVHWQLLSPSTVFPYKTSELLSNTVPFDLAGQKVLTLPPKIHCAYLLAHGSKHIWSRVQWLLETYLMYEKSGFDFQFLWEEAKIKKTSVQAVLFFSLINLLWNIPIPDMNYKNTKKINGMIKTSLREMQMEREDVTARGFKRFRRPAFISKLNSSLSHKIKTFAKIGTNSHDWQIIYLPDSLFFLYFPLRPFLWFYDVYLKKKRKQK